MSWVAVAIAGGAVVGAVGSNMAAKKQVDASGRAAQIQEDMYLQTREDLAPWMKSGNLALQDLQARMGLGQADATNPNFGQLTHQFNLQDFQQSPAYQFNLEQGKLALDKASASRGKFYAPSTLQDIAKYSQGLASNEYQNAFSNYQTNMGNIWNRLYGLSSAGQAAANQTGTFGTQAGQNIGNNIVGAGNAQAAGIVGGTNAITGGVNNYLNYQLVQQALARNQGSSVGGGGGGGLDPSSLLG